MSSPQIITLIEKVTQRFSEEHRNAQGSAGSPKAHASLSNLLLQMALHSSAGSSPGRDLSVTPSTVSGNFRSRPLQLWPVVTANKGKKAKC